MCIKSWPSDLSETGYIGFDHHRIICVIDHKAGFLARGFPYLLALYIVDLNLVGAAAAGIVGRQTGRVLVRAVRQLPPACLYDDMGTGHTLCVKPPVSAIGDFKSHFLILKVILAYIDIKSVRREVMQRFALGRPALALMTAVLFDIAVFSQLLADLREIFFAFCKADRGGYGFQEFDFILRFRQLKYLTEFSCGVSCGSSGTEIGSLV